VAAIVGALLTGCVGPARTERDYRLKARSSARAAGSAVESATLAAVLVRERKTFSNYVVVVLDSAERDASSVQSTFASIQPPAQEQDALRDRMDTLLSDAVDAISAMRIAARRHAWSELLRASVALPKLTRELRAYQELRA
jgi:hypothetical protein